jgi:hypothetical protein
MLLPAKMSAQDLIASWKRARIVTLPFSYIFQHAHSSVALLLSDAFLPRFPPPGRAVAEKPRRVLTKLPEFPPYELQQRIGLLMPIRSLPFSPLQQLVCFAILPAHALRAEHFDNPDLRSPQDQARRPSHI